MKVLFAAAEMSPLAKVGGLGDVVGSLPRALRAAGADVHVAMPMHGTIERATLPLNRLLQGVRVPWPVGGAERVDVWQADVGGVPVYLIENERYFGRATVYGFDDDRDRFLFFCDALLASAPHLGFKPDVLHIHDWHAALLLTRLVARPDHAWARAGRVYTIHNLALQGNFDGGFAQYFGIDPRLLVAPDGVPPEATYSAMAQGILHADRVNTVSDTYAREILTPEYGAGLDALLRARSAVVSGIVNGIDYDEFNPATDPAIPAHFTIDTLDARTGDKRALQREAGLPESDDALFGVVTRLWAQKGIDLVAEAFGPVLERGGAQLAVLGTGDPEVHQQLLDLEARFPRQMKVWLEFNPPLGQRVYAGCDVFLMPSRYEPCGLGQLISLRYGAVPLVRRCGGLADTVDDADAGLTRGNGFVFERADASELRAAVERALAAYGNRAAWRTMQERGMRQDWSWGRAAGRYLELYAAAVADRTAAMARPAT